MTGRQKIEAALSAEGTSQIPAVICYEEIMARDHWSEVTHCPWWYAGSPDVDQEYEWRRDLIDRIGQDWFVLARCLPSRERGNLYRDEGEDGVFEIDLHRRVRRLLSPPTVAQGSPSAGNLSIHPERLASTPEEIDAAIPIPARFRANHLITEGRHALAEKLLRVYGTSHFPIVHVNSPLWSCYALWGFEGLMTLIATHPDLVQRACGRFSDLALRQIQEAQCLGAAGVWIEECMTDMISPRSYELLDLPHVRRLAEGARESGLRSIYYFCGAPKGKWDLILDSGVDALAFEERKKGFDIDIEEVVNRTQGRLAVLGNLDALHLLGQSSEEDLKAEIARQIAAGRKNRSRFIMSIGSPITPSTPLARVRLYCDLVHELGG